MTPELGRCRHCGRLVPATPLCRACGYDADPERNRRARFVWGLVGASLTLTVGGAPVGLLCLLKARGHHRAMTGRVVAEESRPPAMVVAARAVRRRLSGSGGRHGGGG
ncbi:hypothetical protein C475_20158 [Halosimplex carlsbadense 2-9-1]|uniref:Uncharacterized protein n=1 Tax=Halosimplex carlsbadense 2-9-1 TaxID=797114 RepID=M0CDB1_9EURY|nr:hypothetical protein [Halosimplex carlsbadense]ELZ20613.1 hypothetical protein C475_20158 [Halosimplex carlsbadense 2-9-1]